MMNPTISIANDLSFSSPLPNNTLLASLKYEAKENTSLENPILDPNFNTLRNKDMNKGQAVILVGGILLIAVLAPLVTWWYFSN
ncbi:MULTISPECIES: hypothetical protein [Prochlorococcus]|uniref:hypothetical protein n=1 Tax=Prochlorococcus TaxID=1218 RepID=UPI000533AB06|nr:MULTISPECIES: hypothetical protein [Prochlorococcus]KGG12429.1 putative Fusion glycoprotein F0 [Prochlorococcus sp. MIT 0601]